MDGQWEAPKVPNPDFKGEWKPKVRDFFLTANRLSQNSLVVARRKSPTPSTRDHGSTPRLPTPNSVCLFYSKHIFSDAKCKTTEEDASIYKYKTAGLALDLWQVKSGTIFDDFIVTDSIEEAKAFAEETFLKKREAEKAAKKVLDDEEAKKMEAEMEAQKAKDKATKEAEGDKPKDEPASEEKKAEEEHEEL